LAHASGYGGIANNCCSPHAWRDLLQQFQPLAPNTEFVRREAGDVAARPCRPGVTARGSGGGLSKPFVRFFGPPYPNVVKRTSRHANRFQNKNLFFLPPAPESDFKHSR
jgi:hypothetical protein